MIILIKKKNKPGAEPNVFDTHGLWFYFIINSDYVISFNFFKFCFYL